MAYDRQVDTTLEQAFEDLADKLAGMTGWSMANDQRGTGHIAVESNVSGEYFVLRSTRMGDGSDADHPFQIQHCDSYTDLTAYNVMTTFYLDTDQSHTWAQPGDSAQYWLQYSQDYGFVYYFRRDAGDGQDWSFWISAMDYGGPAGTEYWDPRTADSHSGHIPRYMVGDGVDGNWGNYDQAYFEDESNRWGNEHGKLFGASENGVLKGLLNPDSALNNYIWWSTRHIVDTDISDPDTGQSPVFATIDDPLWLEDRSGTDINTGDVVQDSDGNDEWEIVDYYDNRVAIRMI